VHFAAVTESPARIEPRTAPRRRDGTVVSYWGTVECPRTGSTRTLDDCLHCTRFVAIRRSDDGRSASLRCLCCDDDPLTDVRAQGSWRTVVPELPLSRARLLASACQATMLLVARANQLLGVVHCNELAAAHGTVSAYVGTVATHMITEPWSLASEATVGDAVEALRELRVPGLLVVGPDARLINVICAADLRRIGVPAQLLR
jgi:CBS domain-containing protein